MTEWKELNREDAISSSSPRWSFSTIHLNPLLLLLLLHHFNPLLLLLLLHQRRLLFFHLPVESLLLLRCFTCLHSQVDLKQAAWKLFQLITPSSPFQVNHSSCSETSFIQQAV